MILTITPNPALDITLYVDGLKAHDTNRVLKREADAGGKGLNLSRVAAELGARTAATGFLGGGTGAEVLHVLHEQGVRCGFVELTEPTRTNFNIEDGSGRPPTTFNSAGAAVEAAKWEDLLAQTEAMAEGSDWACVGGSLPQGLPADACVQLLEAARRKGCRVLVDADGESMRLALAAGPDLVKPNLREAERLLERPLSGPGEALGAARELLVRQADGGSAEPMAIISLGAEGAILAFGSEAWLAPGIPIQPKSTVGSGDSLLGGFLAALQLGRGPAEALRWGSAAGAATALTDGSEIARRPVFEGLLERAEVRPL